MIRLSAVIGRRLGRLVWGICGLVLAAPLPASAQGPTEVVEYYALDAVGSVRVVFDASGSILGRMDFTPFGGELVPGQALPSQRFAGLFRDGEAGLDYARARSYQVRTGRFNAPDPVFTTTLDPQRWNRYSYALNAPLSFIDVHGLNAAPTATPGSCPAEFSHSDCGGERLFWRRASDEPEGGGGGGFSFGAAYAQAVSNGFNPAMPPEFWVGQQTMNANANAAFAQAQERSPRPSVSTKTEVTLPDGKGTRVVVRDANAMDALLEAGRVAAPFTKPRVYVEIVAASAASGVALRTLPLAVNIFQEYPWSPLAVQQAHDFAMGISRTSAPPPTPAGAAGWAIGQVWRQYVFPCLNDGC